MKITLSSVSLSKSAWPGLRIKTEKLKRIMFILLILCTCLRGLPLLYYGTNYCVNLLSHDFYSSDMRFMRCMSKVPSEFLKQYLQRTTALVTFLGGRPHFQRFKAFQSALATHSPESNLVKSCFVMVPSVNGTLLSLLDAWRSSSTTPDDENGNKLCVAKRPTHLIIGSLLVPYDARSQTTLAGATGKLQSLLDQLEKLKGVKIIWINRDPIGYRVSKGKIEDLPCLSDSSKTDTCTTQVKTKGIRLFGSSDRCIVLLKEPAHNRTVEANLERRTFEDSCLEYTGKLLPYMVFDAGSECCHLAFHVTPAQKRLFYLFLAAVSFATVCATLKLCFERTDKTALPFLREGQAHSSGLSKMQTYFRKFHEFSWLLSKFGLFLLYFFVRKRTIIYEHKKHRYGFWKFYGSLVMFLVIGLISTQVSSSTNFNSVDITREWKGWMQIYIVMFHYCLGGGIPQQVLSRILVSSYLFLTGYGHFCYYWKQRTLPYTFSGVLRLRRTDIENFGNTLMRDIKRYLDIMFRLNLLLFTVCITVKDNYMDHYYIPLTITWYTAVAVLMLAFPRVSFCSLHSVPTEVHSTQNQNLRETHGVTSTNYVAACDSMALREIENTSLHFWRNLLFVTAVMTTKIIILACVSTALVDYPQFFDLVFFVGPYRYFFNGSRSSWRWRFSNDAYTAIYGITFGFVSQVFPEVQPKIVTKLRKTHVWRLLQKSFFVRLLEEFQERIYLRCTWFLPMLLAMGGCMICAIPLKVLLQCPTEACVYSLNKYMCIFPIMGYITMRNAFPFIRRYYSNFFAKIGDISMEVYILHCLGGGSDLLLFLQIPDIFNAIIEGLILFCVSHELHNLTGNLHTHFVPTNKLELLCKTVIFVPILAFLTMTI